MAHPEAGRHDNIHGDENAGIDVAPYVERALDDIVEDIFDFGRYPRTGHAAFDLKDWIIEHEPVSALVRSYAAYLTGGYDFNFARDRDSIGTRLRDHLRDSDFVQERAIEIAKDAREDHE